MATVATEQDIAQLDEALMHASLIPLNERGPAWHAWTNALLEQRRRLQTTPRTYPPTPHTRVLQPQETR